MQLRNQTLGPYIWPVVALSLGFECTVISSSPLRVQPFSHVRFAGARNLRVHIARSMRAVQTSDEKRGVWNKIDVDNLKTVALYDDIRTLFLSLLRM
jgi:hypothetical protein